MPKNIILLADGTGNTSAALFTTNVWRLYQALDVSDPHQQVAYYHNGVGTSSFKPLAILGGVFGYGLKRNVIDLYCFLCRNYAPGDRIFGFGFSRGSFTIRVLTGLITRFGLVPYGEDERELYRQARTAYRLYRESCFVPSFSLFVRPYRAFRKLFSSQPADFIEVEQIHFLGLWDTVAAYGGPIEEITTGIDKFVWPFSLPDRYLSAKVRRACHALALDDERQAFWPMLWDEAQVSRIVVHPDGSTPTVRQPIHQDWHPPGKDLPPIDRQRLSQVWFTGMHSDVGGGYSQDGLSYVTLDWMIDRAEVYGLRLNPRERTRLIGRVNEFDKLNDSRHGLGGYYRYKPRKLETIYAAGSEKETFGRDISHMVSTMRGAQAATAKPSPVVHESVLQRMSIGDERYAPIVIPEVFHVATATGDILDPSKSTAQLSRRASLQEAAWDIAWKRRIVYFLTFFATAFLALLPFINMQWPGLGQASPMEILIPVVTAISYALPNFASFWLDAFKQAPERLFIGAVLVGFFLWVGGHYQQAIFDTNRKVWMPFLRNRPDDGRRYDSRIRRLRTHIYYRGFFYALNRWVLPLICAAIIYVIIIYALFVIGSRILFPAAEIAGLICRNDGSAQEVIDRSEAAGTFATDKLCNATGLKVTRGRTYLVRMTLLQRWADKGIATDPNGFGSERATWSMAFGLPLRRVVSANWFQTIVRVGSRGSTEQPLTFKPDENPCDCPKPEPREFTAEFTPRRNGEVFLFVNDSVIGLPWIADYFYRTNNEGQARIVIELKR
ncbi:MAG: DUF2235 domain-containing protein [Xanthobacteraceae bacterium]